jgi:hypothetical protein
MRMQHLVLTRFNLKIPSLKGGTGADREWMDHRLGLFERYCLPSMKNQTCKDFRWIALFDKDTGKDYRKRIEAHASAFPNLEPYFLPYEERDAPVRAAIAQDTDLLVSTRLDNDDAFRFDAVEVIQKHARGMECAFLNLLDGYALGKDGRVYAKRQPSNPFISLVEKRSSTPFRTVWCGVQHTAMETIAPIRNIEGEPRWLQVIHGRNWANSIWVEPPPSPLRSLRRLAGRMLRALRLRPPAPEIAVCRPTRLTEKDLQADFFPS